MLMTGLSARIGTERFVVRILVRNFIFTDPWIFYRIGWSGILFGPDFQNVKRSIPDQNIFVIFPGLEFGLDSQNIESWPEEKSARCGFFRTKIRTTYRTRF